MTFKTVRTEVEYIDAHYWSICDRPREHEDVICDWTACNEPATCVAFLLDDALQLEATASTHFLYCGEHGARVLEVAQEAEVKLSPDDIMKLWEEWARAVHPDH